ncbi:MAG TPA: hypothetical protein VNB59_04830, partial [Solirubrobacterales bacterium]|nr:hypothetical protein [Solirubrobacterales bacterium]
MTTDAQDPAKRPRITITADQRDAVYDAVLTHLSGIGDLLLVVEENDLERAYRLGREFSDDLRLVLDDLGWGRPRWKRRAHDAPGRPAPSPRADT